jgi:prepilin-type N-terminal cleavage/methylation domain-containing protein
MNRARAGYSLIEVLVAFAIMSMVLTALIPGQARLLGRASDADQSALAFEYALSVGATLGVSTPLQLGSDTWRYRDWQIEHTTTQLKVIETGALTLTKITVRSAQNSDLARFETLGFIPRAE